MTTIIVTGAAGLVGRAVVARLARSHEVVALARRPSEGGNGARLVVADLADPAFIAALPSRADAVVHLAQAERYADFPHSVQDVLAVNVVALTKLLDWARKVGVQSFTHASTGGLYGRGARAFTEADPVRVEGPLSFYFRTKHCAELFAQEYARYFNVAALRPFFVYGPDQRAEMLLPRLAAAVREQRPVRLAGPYGMRLNPLHVEDMAAAVETCLSVSGNYIFNVAGPDILSIREIAELLGAAVGRAPVFEQTEEVADADIIGDTSRLRERRWRPRIRLCEAAEEICNGL